MAFTEDLSLLFDDDQFAIEVLIAGVPTLAIFDAAFERASLGELGMATTEPVLRLPTALVPQPATRTPVVVAGVPYRVAEHQPDGTGISLLYLEKT